MKIQINSAPPVFTPKSITITFESQEELDAMGSIFNHGHVNSFLLRKVNGDPKIWKSLESIGADLGHNGFEVFTRERKN